MFLLSLGLFSGVGAGRVQLLQIMEQIYLPLADFVRPNNLAGDQSLFLKNGAWSFNQGQTCNRYFSRGGNILKEMLTIQIFFMNCLKKIDNETF